MAAAAVWDVFDLWAAAATHAVLAAGASLAIRAWDRPRFLPAVSLLALSSASFAMAAGHLEPAELGVGWSLLALLHVIAAVRLRARPGYATPDLCHGPAKRRAGGAAATVAGRRAAADLRRGRLDRTGGVAVVAGPHAASTPAWRHC